MDEIQGRRQELNHELVVPNEDIPCKMFLFEGGQGNYRRAKHWHQSVEIFLVQEGELEFYINEERLPLKAGELVIVNSNELHSIEAPRKNRTIVVQIPIAYFADYIREGDYAVFSRQPQEETVRLAHLIGEMYLVYERKEKAYELKVRGLFYELLYRMVTELMELEQDEGQLRQKRRLDRLSKITAYMKAHYNGAITLEGVAREFGFSPTYLSRMFNRYAGVSYKTYLLDLRTEYGLREMLGTDHSLNDVALNNGFPDSRAFARAFFKRYGCKPSDYRRLAEKRARK